MRSKLNLNCRFGISIDRVFLCLFSGRALIYRPRFPYCCLHSSIIINDASLQLLRRQHIPERGSIIVVFVCFSKSIFRGIFKSVYHMKERRSVSQPNNSHTENPSYIRNAWTGHLVTAAADGPIAGYRNVM